MSLCSDTSLHTLRVPGLHGSRSLTSTETASWGAGLSAQGHNQKEVGKHLKHADSFKSSGLWKCPPSLNLSKDFCNENKKQNKIKYPWTSLVAQWIRICLPMQGA